jgi:hypothetical protein
MLGCLITLSPTETPNNVAGIGVKLANDCSRSFLPAIVLREGIAPDDVRSGHLTGLVPARTVRVFNENRERER